MKPVDAPAQNPVAAWRLISPAPLPAVGRRSAASLARREPGFSAASSNRGAGRGLVPIRLLGYALRAVLVLLLVAGAAQPACGQAAKPAPAAPSPEALRLKELERDSAINLSLAKKSVQEDAFYNAKVALNVWKTSAVEAGNFDPKLYDELRKQLYDKSIRDNLRCIDVAIAQRDAPEANLCLKIYRLHAQEINAFDLKRYEDLRSRVNGIRKKEK